MARWDGQMGFGLEQSRGAAEMMHGDDAQGGCTQVCHKSVPSGGGRVDTENLSWICFANLPLFQRLCARLSRPSAGFRRVFMSAAVPRRAQKLNSRFAVVGQLVRF